MFYARLLVALIPGITAVLATASCSRNGETDDEARVQLAFALCRNALINHQAGQVLACIPHDVDDYLNRIVSGADLSSSSPESLPGVDLFLRTALEKKVPPDLRPHLTLGILIQRISDKHLLSPRDVQNLSLGPRVTINGNRASAEIYYQQTLTALRLPFIKEDGAWKIDVMSILPYVEVLMRVDRAIKGETEAGQVEQLVKTLPSL